MAQLSTVFLDELDEGIILSPERYDPRRRQEQHSGVRIDALAKLSRESAQADRPMEGAADRFIVLDTSHAHEGYVIHKRTPVQQSEIGSQKRRLRPGDVIISRLRPYLRQVAYVDEGLFIWNGERVEIVCSTEFYVLRGGDSSIAFLAPFLLARKAQEALCAAQEGGHHPRVNRAMLTSLRVPDATIAVRHELSAQVETLAKSFRDSVTAMRQLIEAPPDQ